MDTNMMQEGLKSTRNVLLTSPACAIYALDGLQNDISNAIVYVTSNRLELVTLQSIHGKECKGTEVVTADRHKGR